MGSIAVSFSDFLVYKDNGCVSLERPGNTIYKTVLNLNNNEWCRHNDAIQYLFLAGYALNCLSEVPKIMYDTYKCRNECVYGIFCSCFFSSAILDVLGGNNLWFQHNKITLLIFVGTWFCHALVIVLLIYEMFLIRVFSYRSSWNYRLLPFPLVGQSVDRPNTYIAI